MRKLHKTRLVLFGTRRRKAASAVCLLFLISGSAFAAWAIVSGGSGPAAGKFQTATTSNALVFAATPSLVTQPLAPSVTGDLGVTITNNATVAESISSITATFTSSPTDCASHLTFLPTPFVGVSVGAGASLPLDALQTVHADATLPVDCSAGSFTAALTAVTNP